MKEIVVEYDVGWDFIDIEVELLKFYEDLFVRLMFDLFVFKF